MMNIRLHTFIVSVSVDLTLFGAIIKSNQSYRIFLALTVFAMLLNHEQSWWKNVD